MLRAAAHSDRRKLTPEQVVDAQTELQILLQSEQFSGSKRCCEFLEFVVENAFAGDYENLTERVLGAELFGRPIDYETASDAIVRVRANDVRRRLAQHYSEERPGSRIRVSLPSGSYIPEFHWLTPKAPAAPADAAGASPSLTGVAAASPAARVAVRSGTLWQRLSKRLLVATVWTLVIGCCAVLWVQKRALQRSFYPWQYEPSVSSFWSDILKANTNTDIVLADTSYGLLQATTGLRFGLNDYINRSYISKIEAQQMRPEMHATLSRIGSWRLASTDEFKLAQGILALDPLGQRIHIYSARDFMPDLIKRDNVVLIGGRLTNPWEELFENRLNFTMEFDNSFSPTVINKAPVAGERNGYRVSGPDNEYCLVAYLPNPDHKGVAILLEGTDAVSSEAAGDFLLSEDQLSNFRRKLHVTRLPYFEALLKVSEVRGTPLTATIEAYRTYPNLH